MSLHKSLVTRSALKRHRNVLTRAERVKQLEEDDKLGPGDSIFGLAKVRVRRVRTGGKHKKPSKTAEKEAEETTTEE